MLARSMKRWLLAVALPRQIRVVGGGPNRPVVSGVARPHHHRDHFDGREEEMKMVSTAMMASACDICHQNAARAASPSP